MSDGLITLINTLAARWVTLLVAVSLDTTLLLMGVGLIWLVIRRRVAPQVGYGLFLLVPLKLLLPVVVPVPVTLADWTPSTQILDYFQLMPIDARPANNAALISPSRSPPEVKLTPPAPRPDLPTARPAIKSVLSGNAPASTPIVPGPRLSITAVVMLVWLVGVIVGLVRFWQAQVRFQARIRTATPIEPERFTVDLDELCRRADVRRSVRFVMDDALKSPAVAGLWRPTLILPRGIETKLQGAQLRWVLLHELAHITRGDLLVALVQRCAAIVHFFNPLVWVANRMINQLREYACDDHATALGEATPVEAGEAYVGVLRLADQSRRGLHGTLGIAALDSRSTCFRRVNRLLDGDRPMRIQASWLARLGLVMVAILVLPHFRGVIAAIPTTQQTAPVAGSVPQLRNVNMDEFRLTVVDPDGQPIAAAVVDFQTSPLPTAEDILRGQFLKSGSYRAAVQADETGRIVVRGPAEKRSFAFWITIPGYGPYWGSWSSNSHNEAIPHEFTARLDRAWRVGSVLVDPAGQPVVGAKLRVWIESKKRPDDVRQMSAGAFATSDEQGRWSYPSVPVELGEVSVEIKSPGLKPTIQLLPRTEFKIEPGAVPTSRIQLERGLTVRGRISDDAGQPIAGAMVRTEFHNAIVQDETDGDGTYRLVGCEPIMTTIVVTAPGKAADFREVNAAPDMNPVDFTLQPGRTIRVRVLNQQGQPEAKARIFFQRWRGQQLYFAFNAIDQYADDAGVWTWNEAPPDQFLADICPAGQDGMQLTSQPLTPRSEEYVFRLPPSLVISGTVIDAETSRPIDQFRVVPGGRMNDQLYWLHHMTFPATNGQFTYRGDRSGSAYLVQVEAQGYQPVASRDIGWNEGKVALTFALRRAAGTGSRVLTPDGQPAAGAKIALSNANAQISIKSGQIDESTTFATRATTDAAGRFSVPAQSSRFQVVVTHPSGYANVTSPVDGEPLGDIALQPWCRVEGTFRIGSALADHVLIQLQASGDPSASRIARISNHYQTATDSQGRFVFDRVIPGRGWVGRNILLTVENGAMDVTSSHLVSLDLPPGKTIEVNLGGTGVAVIGKLSPLPGYQGEVFWNFALINVRREEREAQPTDSFTATVAPDGTFRIDDVPPGKYLLSARFDKHDAGAKFRYPFEVGPSGVNQAIIPVDLGTIQLVTPATR